ncbi:MAG: hypothetical protein ABIK73_06725 [candidate division WOR-3 bacterium]
MAQVRTNVNNICFGVGNVIIDGRTVGAIQGEIVLTETRTVKEIDDVAQYPGQTLKVRMLGRKWFLRLNLYEANLQNLQLALEGDVDGEQSKLVAGGTSSDKYVREHTIEIYGQGADLKNRKFYAYRAVVVEPGEINLFSNEGTRIPITFQLLPVPGVPASSNVFYILDYQE